MRAAIGAVGLLVVGLAATGCKATTALNNLNNCTITLSGSKTGTYNCAPAGVAFNSTKDTSGFGLSLSASGSRPNVATAISWGGQPAATDYVDGMSANSLGGMAVTDTMGAVWSTAATGGSYDLKITNVGTGVTSGNTTAYSSTGTLTATLAAMGGTPATGTITVSVTF